MFNLDYAKRIWRLLKCCPDLVDKQTLIQQHQFIQNLLDSPRYADPKRLNHHEHQVLSQNGEDGVISEIFKRIGKRDQVFVEIGVGDGSENNTVYLLQQGWRGSWIEGNSESTAVIGRSFAKLISKGDLHLRQAFVTAENIQQILVDLNAPKEFDLLSLDIDRNTWHVWRALKEYRPRVVVVEYNSHYPADVDWKVEYSPTMAYNGTAYFGGSLKAFENLGKEMGYSLVGCELVGANAFFVRSDLCADKFAAPYTSENHYEPARFFLMRRDGHPRCFTDLP